MLKKLPAVIVIFLFLNNSVVFSQENISLNTGHRLTIANYSSYQDNIGILEAGYDLIFVIPYISPEYNIMDFGIGLSSLFVFDNIGNPRIPVFGFGLNGSMRLYTPAIKKARLFLEGIMSLVIYSKEYPANGTMLNGGWHLGGGIEYCTVNNARFFSKVLWFHTSNNDVYGRDRNPAINALGLAVGVRV